jgi:hypothetical protein
LLSCRLVDPELSAFEAMDPCCGAGIHLVLFSANGYGLTVVLLMRCCLCQHKRQDWFCFRGADYQGLNLRLCGCQVDGMPRTPPRVTLRFTRRRRAIVVEQLHLDT